MTPEKAYEETARVLAASPKETGSQVLAEEKLLDLLGYFWTRESFTRVVEKLVTDKVLKPLEDGGHLVLGCFLCGKLLPAGLENTTVLDGKHVHLECYLNWKKGRRNEKVEEQQPSSGDMVRLLRARFPCKFVEVEFLKFTVDNGWSQGDALALLKTLERDGSIFKTSGGAWVWA